MMQVRDVKRWLDSLHEDASIAVDEGGLALVEVGTNGETYLEIGCEPEREEAGQ